MTNKLGPQKEWVWLLARSYLTKQKQGQLNIHQGAVHRNIYYCKTKKRKYADMIQTNNRARAVTGGGRVEAARPKYPPPAPFYR